ncbi:MAG: flagellar motor switch protein FliN [Desulfuromonadales bacterium C00003093]|nr:MAG: flagellar motor switch protein FliN [Desulfuromonadales bacterium C00003093]
MEDKLMSETTQENGQQTATASESLEGRGLDLLLDIPLQVSVEVGRSKILVRDLLQLQEGSLVELDKLAGEPLELYVNSRLIARGEAVVVNDKFGLRLTDVVSPAERIENLG